jgi:hypothetical protein
MSEPKGSRLDIMMQKTQSSSKSGFTLRPKEQRRSERPRNQSPEYDVSGEMGDGGQTDKNGNPNEMMTPNINLSRGELLKLLSVFEGELQARDEVIAILKSEVSQKQDTRYGMTGGMTPVPQKALQRDSASLDPETQNERDESINEMKKVIEHQKSNHKRLKRVLVSSEQKYQQLLLDLEAEKRKNQEFMMKSEDFVSLIETDRDRLKKIIQQEKTAYEKKERDLSRKLMEKKDEPSRLKSISIELAEDRQKHIQSYHEQKEVVTKQQEQLKELQSKVVELEEQTTKDKEHALQLELELEEQSNALYNENEDLTKKLKEEKVKSAQLETKVNKLHKQMKKVRTFDKNLSKTDDQLRRITQKLDLEENDDLLEEIDMLRETVAEMQEAEKIYASAQEHYDELRTALEDEVYYSTMMKDELDRLKKSYRNQVDIQRCCEEANFRMDEIKEDFDKERSKNKRMDVKIKEYCSNLMTLGIHSFIL